jgi:hypothetical protein
MPSVIREYHGSFSGCEGSVEYQIHFEVTSSGYPAQGPSYSSGGQPAEGPEWEITKIEEGVYLPDRSTPEWVDIKETSTPEQIAHIESWAADLDLSDEVHEAIDDERIAAEEYRYEQRHDMTGYDD